MLTGEVSDHFYVPNDREIDHIYCSVALGDGITDTVFDVRKNGTTIFPTSPKPTVLAGDFLGAAVVPDVTTVVGETDYLQVVVEDNGGASGRGRVYIVFA
jgi:hypothetical protein